MYSIKCYNLLSEKYFLKPMEKILCSALPISLLFSISNLILGIICGNIAKNYNLYDV